MHDFSPPKWLAGGHRMTLYAWAHQRRFPDLPDPTARFFDVEPGTQVLAHCHWQPSPLEHPTLVALHGLEGSSDAKYVLGIAHKALRAGFNVVRLNQRNCGGTEHLSEGLYHSGLTADVRAVMTELAEHDGLNRIAVAGYSLGGNLALRLAGQMSDDAPPWLRAVCAVSPTLELDTCMKAIERPQNRIYERNFMSSLRRRMQLKAKLFPGKYDVSGIDRVRRIRAFDERCTAPHHGFTSAADYYHQAAAMRVVDRIRVPTLIITAEDDPFIPPEQFRDPRVTGNPHITLTLTKRGGHCAFIERARDGYDGYWAEASVVEFVSEATDCSRPAGVDRLEAALAAGS